LSSNLSHKIKAGIDSFKKLSATARSFTLVVVAYVITIWLAILIIAFAIISLLGTYRCSTMGQALVVLWITIAVLFLTSAIVVGVVARKIYSRAAGYMAIVAVYGAALLISYIFIAFVLLIAFNC
jgi:hypothetical protein